MNDRVFLDTNILIYLYSADEPDKRVIAERIPDGYEVIISTQVVNEFINVMTKKYKIELPAIA